MKTAQNLILIAVLLCLSATISVARSSESADTAADAKTLNPNVELLELDSINNLIELRDKKSSSLNKLIEGSGVAEEIKEQDSIVSVEVLQTEIAEIENQINALASGVSETDFDLSSGNTIDLKAEVEQLIQPFIIMMRSATEEARQIEGLRRKLSIARTNREIASRALEQVAPLIENSQQQKITEELLRIQAQWQEKYDAANDLTNATDHQLQLKLDQRESPSDSANQMASSFFKERGLNLVKGLGLFIVTLVGFRFIGNMVGRLRQSRGIAKTFASRLTALIYSIGTLFIAIIGMMVVFNKANDWLLLGITALFTIAMVWFVVKTLPSLLEQITLYLNLGAVQEDERLMFNGIPWVVKKLDFYTDLVNPDLDGGTFTLPIRQLTGLHSRPFTKDEAWFPTKQGNWVKSDEGLGQVMFQSPGMVQIKLLGGALRHYPAASFFENAPLNLSYGCRVEIAFGVSYKHQAIATDEIPHKLKAFVTDGLLQILQKEQLLDVDVELLKANDSSMDYQIEADITGDAACHYETVERTLTRLCVEACNKYGWEIPFPQMVMHQA